MKIRNILYMVMIGAAALVSCSDIAEDERFIKGDAVSVGRNVLIEDFTGQRCLNCPKAMEAITKMHESFGDNVIAVGIYGGPFGKTVAGKYLELTTETGEYYNTKNNVTEQPFGCLNRMYSNSDYVTWEGTVAELLGEQTYVEMECATSYDSATRNLKIDITASGLEDVEETFLQVWLTEDNITSIQLLPDGSTDRSFIHNHVFRTSVNERDGEPVTISKGVKTEKTYNITLNEKWKAENMDVVAFVFTKKGVEQVIKTRVVE